jgi:hypothetical protein
MVTGMRADRLRAKKDREPCRCPACGMIFNGLNCPGCGFQAQPGMRKSRPVVSMTGTARELIGDIFQPRRVMTRPGGQDLWVKMYFRSLKGKGIKTFRAAEALFAYENNWEWPDRNWPFMPKLSDDWFKLIPDVPREDLT